MKEIIYTQQEYREALRKIQRLWNQKSPQKEVEALIKNVDFYEKQLWRKKAYGPSLAEIQDNYNFLNPNIPILLETGA